MSENQPQRAPEQKSPLEANIERTAAARDDVTMRLLPDLLPSNTSPLKFIQDACSFAGIDSPKQGDKLASYVYKLQKDVCKFADEDSGTGCDGKLGPLTFRALLANIPQLKAQSKVKRAAPFKAGRRNLAASMGLPTPPAKPKLRAKLNDSLPKIPNPQNALTIGDSLTYGFARYFYRGTDKYKRYNKEAYKVGWSVVKIRKSLENNLASYANIPAFSIWGGTNDISYRSADKIAGENIKMANMLLAQNPKARITLISLLPFKKYQGKIEAVNQKLAQFAQEHPNNVTFINLHDQVLQAQQQAHKKGKRVFYRDGVHLRPKYSKAIAKLLQDHLANNIDGNLTDYT